MELTIEEKIANIKNYCLTATSKNPIDVARGIMNEEYIPMHGPIHHIVDGSAFLVALHNVGMEFDLDYALEEMSVRGQLMPGGTCGRWGMCGSASSVAAALAIINKTGPLSDNEFYKDNLRITSRALAKMSEMGGPRCCKRNAFISLTAAMDVVEESYNVKFDRTEIKCSYSKNNPNCIGKKCMFNA